MLIVITWPHFGIHVLAEIQNMGICMFELGSDVNEFIGWDEGGYFGAIGSLRLTLFTEFEIFHSIPSLIWLWVLAQW